jgi:hypothetical protein
MVVQTEAAPTNSNVRSSAEQSEELAFKVFLTVPRNIPSDFLPVQFPFTFAGATRAKSLTGGASFQV